MWGGVLVATVVALPAAALAVGALAWWRVRRGAARGWAWRASGAEVGMVAGTAPWVWMILTPTASAGAGEHRVALVPVRDLAAVLAGEPGEALTQVGGNVLVLAALGFLLPVRIRFGRGVAGVLGRVSMLAAGVSVLVEMLQYALDLGRVSSVDDVLLNTAGALLAAACSYPWWRRAG